MQNNRYTMEDFQNLEQNVGGFHIDTLDTVESLTRELTAEYGAERLNELMTQ